MPTPTTRALPASLPRISEACRLLVGLTFACLLTPITMSRPAVALETGGSVLAEVRHVRDARGHVLVALCTQTTFLTAACPYHGAVPAAAGTVVVRIDGVPPGSYSAQAFQDDNDSKTLERTFFGLPSKGLGFSRDARMHFGPPRFDDAAFKVANTATSVFLTLHYY